MDRHADWCVVVALVGEGQEINRGEAGIDGWFEALGRRFPDWDVFAPPSLLSRRTSGTSIAEQLGLARTHERAALHLATSLRSFRSERVSEFVAAVVDGDVEAATSVSAEVRSTFALYVTRDSEKARDWARDRDRGNETVGMLASSGGLRLRPHGIHVKNALEPEDWFLNPPEDVRSSSALEVVATEFDVQGLELDWCVVAWDADFRFRNGAFEHWQFKGTRWQRLLQADAQRYLVNSYRVLLTRACQGMVVFVPEEAATTLPARLSSTIRPSSIFASADSRS